MQTLLLSTHQPQGQGVEWELEGKQTPCPLTAIQAETEVFSSFLPGIKLDEMAAACLQSVHRIQGVRSFQPARSKWVGFQAVTLNPLAGASISCRTPHLQGFQSSEGNFLRPWDPRYLLSSLQCPMAGPRGRLYSVLAAPGDPGQGEGGWAQVRTPVRSNKGAN